MPNVNTLLDEHVVLKCEFVDRIFLNGYVARLQEPHDLAWFLCQHRGEEIPRYEVLGRDDPGLRCRHRGNGRGEERPGGAVRRNTSARKPSLSPTSSRRRRPSAKAWS